MIPGKLYKTKIELSLFRVVDAQKVVVPIGSIFFLKEETILTSTNNTIRSLIFLYKNILLEDFFASWIDTGLYYELLS